MRQVHRILSFFLCFSAAAIVAAAQPSPEQSTAAQVETVAETDADLSSYAARLNDLVSRYANAAMAGVADSGEVRVRFRVRRDGIAQKPIVSLSSRQPGLDGIALQAVSSAMAHIEPLPAEVASSFVDFQVRFVFNQREVPKQEALSLADLARQRAKRPVAEKKVYTNEDVSASSAAASSGRSRSRDPFRAESGAKEDRSGAEGESAGKPSGQPSADKPQEQDPQYYRDRLDPLQAELAEVKRELTRLRNVPRDYRTGLQAERTAGASTISNTVQNDIERFERRQADLERRIVTICDEASRNSVRVSSCSYY